MVGAAAVGIGASLIGGKMQSDAASDTAKEGYRNSKAAQEQADKLNQQRMDEAYSGTHAMRKAEGLGTDALSRRLGLEKTYQYTTGRDDIRGMDAGDYQSVDDPGYMDWEGEDLEQLDVNQYAIDSGAGFGDFLANNEAYDVIRNEQMRGAAASSGFDGMTQSGTAMQELGEASASTAGNFYNSYMGLISDARRTNESRKMARIGMNENRNSNRLATNEQRNVNRRNTEEQRYSNYMNSLNNLAQGRTTGNVASMGVNQGVSSGNQLLSSTAQQNQSRAMGTQATNAAIGDITGGVGNMASAYIYANN